jgi:predicted CXXCH cytochrome family protein
MRPLLLVVLLLSCAGDEARRAPAPARADPPTAEPARAADPPTAQPPRAAAPPRAAEPPRSAEAASVVVAAREPADPRAATRRAAHDALAENCGECHEGHRSTNAKALAVFDLDQPDWPARFTRPRFESALRRLVKKSEPASAAFVAFRDAELSARPD